jgi:hypothetical protein
LRSSFDDDNFSNQLDSFGMFEHEDTLAIEEVDDLYAEEWDEMVSPSE